MRVTLGGMMSPFGIADPFEYSKLIPLPVLVEIPVIPTQPANALSGMTVKLSFLGNTMVPFNPMHPSNAETPIDFRFGGKYKWSVNFRQPRNALSPIVSTLSVAAIAVEKDKLPPMTTHDSNADSPMVRRANASWMSMLGMRMQFWYARRPMELTLIGMLAGDLSTVQELKVSSFILLMFRNLLKLTTSSSNEQFLNACMPMLNLVPK